jgi:hypothetical protein
MLVDLPRREALAIKYGRLADQARGSKRGT